MYKRRRGKGEQNYEYPQNDYVVITLLLNNTSRAKRSVKDWSHVISKITIDSKRETSLYISRSFLRLYIYIYIYITNTRILHIFTHPHPHLDPHQHYDL